jgi:asparagine synthase (glutamine-hydrolysing)
MCGIAGIYSFKDAIGQKQIDSFTDTLAHRGPDGRGTYLDGNLALGHRRLAILDLSEAGRCPMEYLAPDGRRFLITYNGEVYNFLELKRELEALGHRFRSLSDTEVVVAAWAQWGKQALFKFNGMWAFAIWNCQERTLFLCRDRFGIKPLYYAGYNNSIAFASELKSFLALDGFHPALDQELAPKVLGNSYAYEGSTQDTIMAGVKRLPGGCSLTVSGTGQAELSRWWETREHLPEIPARYEDQVQRFRELLLDAVTIRMRSDVPLGSCLSGGVDSSAISSTMAHLHRQKLGDLTRSPADWQRAFVATFPGTAIDERIFAEQVVRHTGSKPLYWVFDQEEGVHRVLDSVWSMEDVYGGLAVPVLCLYQEMRKAGVYVSLDGHGGDELLCGYTWYLDWPMSQVNENLYRDFHQTLLPAILRNYDRCSMASGIEVRMPLMDWRLVTFAFALEARAKIGEGFTKRILRDAMAGIMPESIRRRTAKIGFNSPMIEWFNGGMVPLIEKVVRHPLWLESPFWDGPRQRDEILSRCRAKAWTMNEWGLSLRVWTQMNLVLWQLLFVERISPKDF